MQKTKHNKRINLLASSLGQILAGWGSFFAKFSQQVFTSYAKR
ncbi:hypothetical protein [Aliiglaciecola sp. NS0011-25]